MLRLTVDFPRSHSLMFYIQASGQGSQSIYHCIPYGPHSGSDIWQAVSECSLIYFSRTLVSLYSCFCLIKSSLFVAGGSVLFFCAYHALPTTSLHFQYLLIGQKRGSDTVVEFFQLSAYPISFQKKRREGGKDEPVRKKVSWGRERREGESPSILFQFEKTLVLKDLALLLFYNLRAPLHKL